MTRQRKFTQVGEKLRAARQDLGLTQGELAAAARIRRLQTISDIERGYRPFAATFRAILAALNAERGNRKPPLAALEIALVEDSRETPPAESVVSTTPETEVSGPLDALVGHWLEIIHQERHAARKPSYSIGHFFRSPPDRAHPQGQWCYDGFNASGHAWNSYLLTWDSHRARVVYVYDNRPGPEGGSPGTTSRRRKAHVPHGDGLGVIYLRRSAQVQTPSSGWFVSIHGRQSTHCRVEYMPLLEAMRELEWPSEDVTDSTNCRDFLQHLTTRGWRKARTGR